jgi:hypothetical protein
VVVPFYRGWERGTGVAVMPKIYTTLTWFNGGVEGLSKQGLRWVIGGGRRCSGCDGARVRRGQKAVQDGGARWRLLGGGGVAVVARGRGRP